MSLRDNIEMLEAFGVPAAVLDERIDVTKGTDGLYHHDTNPCPFLQDGVEGNILLSVREATNIPTCSCLWELSPARSDFYYVVNSLSDALDVLHMTSLYMYPERLTAHYWRLIESIDGLDIDETFRRLQGMRGLPEAFERVFDALSDATTSIVGRLRSEEMQPFLPGYKGNTEHLIVALAFVPTRTRFTKRHPANTLMLTYGQERDNGMVLDIPACFTSVLESWAEESSGAGRPALYHQHTLTPEDTPEVIEAAKALWDPTGNADLSFLESAFVAARNLCSVRA